MQGQFSIFIRPGVRSRKSPILSHIHALISYPSIWNKLSHLWVPTSYYTFIFQLFFQDSLILKYNLTLCFSFCGSLPFFLRPHTSFPVDYEQPNAEDFPGLSVVNATEATFGPTELKVGLKLNIQKTRIMASSPITSWKIDGETVETVTDFIILGFKITADGDCSHEIKRHLLLGRKAMTNSILKSRNITLLTKVHLVKAMVFPVVMYGCESWTINKAERQRIDAFELWCWRRLLRVPWTAGDPTSPFRRSALGFL